MGYLWDASGQTLNYFACFIPKSTLPLSLSLFIAFMKVERNEGQVPKVVWCTSWCKR